MDGHGEAASTLLAFHDTLVSPPVSPKQTVRMTDELMSTPPTKYCLSKIKRKSDDMMQLVYVNDVNTCIVVPVRPGDTKDVISKRQRQIAQIEQERSIRLVAYSTWHRKLVSFRYDPSSWTAVNASSSQERFAYKYIQHVKIFAACKQKGVRPLCIGCKNKQPCDDMNVFHFLLPHPSTQGNHKLCDKSLEVFCPLTMEDFDDEASEWLKHIPTCAICS